MRKIFNISQATTLETVADGSPSVMLLVEASGTDCKGKPWSMPIMERVTIENGRMMDVRLFFQDTARLSEIAGAAA